MEERKSLYERYNDEFVSASFFRVFTRTGVCLWEGAAKDEAHAWKRFKEFRHYPESYPVENLMEGRLGFRIVAWPI